jgi:O-antigen/teichoic acid export membrane protein
VAVSHRRRPSGVWGVVGSNVITKALTLGVSGILAVFTTRLIISHFGIDSYAQYGLLASLTNLVPFADLGMSAAIINAVASSAAPATDERVRRTLISALRLMITSAGVLALIAVVISIGGWWPALLGQGLQSGGQIAVLVCVLVFAVALPLGVGGRILTGLGKNHVQIRTQFIPAPFMLVGVLVLVALGVQGGNALPVISYVGSALVALVSLVIASRMIRPQVSSALKDVPKVRSVRGEKVMNVAGPMLAQMLALPIAMQTDRLLLSHLAGTQDLAQYNLGSQLFGMITQTISTAGIALWPLFAKARSAADIRSPRKLAVGFGVGGLAVAGLLGLLMPWIGPLVSDGKVVPGPALVIGFVAFVAAQAVKYPLGMYMTDTAGLRFQVAPIVVMVPLNLGISWALIAPFGAAGPIIGSAIAVTLCQVLPNAWYVRRDLRRRRAAQAAAGRQPVG